MATYFLVFLALVSVCNSISTFEAYLQNRNHFMQVESQLSINAAWKLSRAEAEVEEALQKLKNIDNNLDPNPIQFNIIAMKPTIEKSPLYALLRTFPKGALLHSHDTSSQDMHFYVDISYLPNCLFNINSSSPDYGSLSFLPSKDFVPISAVRNAW